MKDFFIRVAIAMAGGLFFLLSFLLMAALYDLLQIKTKLTSIVLNTGFVVCSQLFLQTFYAPRSHLRFVLDTLFSLVCLAVLASFY